jgi:hypothetical protein
VPKQTECPRGAILVNGACIKPKPRERETKTCPRGTAGIYPNCLQLQQRLPDLPRKPRQPPADMQEAPRGDVQKKSPSGGGLFKPKPRGSMTLPPCKPGEARVGNGPCGPK